MQKLMVGLYMISTITLCDVTIQNTTASTLIVTAIPMGYPNASFTIDPYYRQNRPFKCLYDIVIKARDGEVGGQQVTYHLGDTPCRDMLKLKVYIDNSKLGAKAY